MESPLVVASRYNGPPGSGNGGYTCGLVAARLGVEPVEVTLRLPPPLARPLRVERSAEEVRVLDGDAVVAEARRGAIEGDVPAPVGVLEAEQASSRYAGFAAHAFPTCFVCGPARAAGDGLRIFAGPVAGREGVVAAVWVPDGVTRELVWAALDCPGAFAGGFADRGEMLLGRMTARIDALPEADAPCVVVAWPRGEQGRKIHAGTALYAGDGRLLAHARQTWIAPR